MRLRVAVLIPPWVDLAAGTHQSTSRVEYLITKYLTSLKLEGAIDSSIHLMKCVTGTKNIQEAVTGKPYYIVLAVRQNLPRFCIVLFRSSGASGCVSNTGR